MDDARIDRETALEDRIDDLEAEVDTMTARVSELEDELHGSETERDLLEEKLARAEMTIAQLKGEIPWWMFVLDRVDFSLVAMLVFIAFLAVVAV